MINDLAVAGLRLPLDVLPAADLHHGHASTAPRLPPVRLPFRLPRRTTKSRHLAPAVAGAGVGLLVFLFVGLLPAILTGGAAAAELASVFLGAQAAPRPGTAAFMTLGVVVAATVSAAVFALLGAATGLAIRTLTKARTPGQAAP
jgi:hypothetical protein